MNLEKSCLLLKLTILLFEEFQVCTNITMRRIILLRLTEINN